MNLEAKARLRRTTDQSAVDPNHLIRELQKETVKLNTTAKDWKDAWYAAREAFGTYMLWRHKDSAMLNESGERQ